MDIQKQYIGYNRSIRGSQPIYIVIHDTGDAGATAQNEHDYFSGGDRGASADFFVDSNNVIQIIDTDNYYSWNCGDGKGKYGITNSNSLGIEMCLEKNGSPSDETVQNTVELTRYLMSYYGIGIDNVVRHYDASRKSCPGSFMASKWAKWNDFKNKVANSTKQGWNKNSTGWWFCTDVTNGYYYKNEWKLIDNEWYSFDDQGYARCSVWLQDQGNWYYLKDSCKMARDEWQWIDGECYCFSHLGYLYMNCITPDGYTVDKDGAWDSKIPKK
jgi:N-acetylmuramoyl-L-alanine amidase CwlA